MKIATVMAAVAGLIFATTAAAQTPPTPVRGVVTSLTADSVTLMGKDGKSTVIALTPNWVVSMVRPISADAIKPGSFIGTTEVPQKDGTGRSLEVHIFPPGVKVGEGHYGWNLRKGAMMTNGTVGTVTKAGKGQAMEVTYPTGARKITVPARVPIVEITPGERAMVKRGVPAFVVAGPKPGGGLISGAVVVGLNGKAPPM